jgi:tagatose-1,6-bisphosphate aldolase
MSTHSALDLPASLQPLATPAGAICVLALDHRDALRNAFRRAGIDDVTETTMLDLKARIVDVLGGSASALLLDPPALPRCRRPGVGLLVPLEEQGHEPLGGGRATRLLDDFGPEDAARLGAHAGKLLLYYRADHAPTASRQRALVERVAADCHRHGLALVVEPLAYRLAGEDDSMYADAFAELVEAGAWDISGCGADLLKLQFPGSPAACERLNAAARLPWTLLGGKEVDGPTFADQLEAACNAGARGFIAGRPLWGDAVGLEPNAQEAWLREGARPLAARLAAIADTHVRRRTG